MRKKIKVTRPEIEVEVWDFLCDVCKKKPGSVSELRLCGRCGRDACGKCLKFDHGVLYSPHSQPWICKVCQKIGEPFLAKAEKLKTKIAFLESQWRSECKKTCLNPTPEPGQEE